MRNYQFQSAVTARVLLVLITVFFMVPRNASASDYSVEWELYRLGVSGRYAAVMVLAPAEGHYVYSSNPGPTGLPTRIEPNVSPDDVTVSVLYPSGKPKSQPVGDDVMIYAGRTPIFVNLGVSEPPASQVELSASLNMLVCTDSSCTPVKDAVHSTVWTREDFAEAPWLKNSPWLDAFRGAVPADNGATAGSSEVILSTPGTPSGFGLPPVKPKFFNPGLEVGLLWKAILFGYLAGLILNVMPCVLPVLSLKLSGLMAVGEGKEARASFREHSLLFAAGILFYFMLLAGILAWAGLAWGQLFQSQTLVTVLAGVMFALGLSLFGVFNLPVIDLKAGGESRLQPLFTGFLATLLATPCSGPLLGGVLGWALFQSSGIVFTVFISIGLGMSTPYILFALKPGVAAAFPKPGRWTGILEQVVGLFLMGTTLYLLSILSEAYLRPALFVLFSIAVGAWIWGQLTGLHHNSLRRWSTRAAAVVLIAGASLFAFSGPDASEDFWEEYSPALFMESLEYSHVVVDFTADWCPNCKALEAAVFTSDNLRRWAEEYGLLYIKADLTRDNPAAQELLTSLGSKSIPVVALFPREDAANGRLDPLVLRDIFTQRQFEDALTAVFSQNP